MSEHGTKLYISPSSSALSKPKSKVTAQAEIENIY
jgi:hypothetical protein